MKSFPETQKFLETNTNDALSNEINYLLGLGREAAKKITEIISNVFIKTQTIIKGVIPAEKVRIQTLLDGFQKAAKEKGITNIYIDSDITGWFPNEKVSKTTAGDSRLLRFVKDITHANIISNAKQLNAYQEYDLSDAILRATALVTAGELDEKNNRGIIIYLTNRKNDVPCRLLVWRVDGGQLVLHVRRVALDNKWHAGDGVLVSNEHLGE